VVPSPPVGSYDRIPPGYWVVAFKNEVITDFTLNVHCVKLNLKTTNRMYILQILESQILRHG
jgi:hypothetical protein